MRGLLGGFENAIVLALPILAMVALGTLFALVRRRRMGRAAIRTLGGGVLVGSLVLIAVTTLVPVVAGAPASVNLTPGATIGNYLRFGDDLLSARNLGLNVALFVPFGVGVSWWRRWGIASVGVAGMLVSAAVETIQYVAPLGRAVDIDDVLLNTLGAVLGAVTAVVVRTVATPVARRVRGGGSVREKPPSAPEDVDASATATR